MADSVDSISGFSTSVQGCSEERLLQKRLKFLFMNPCDKFRVKRRFPWKLAMQLFKIVLVTVQLAIFGVTRSGHVNFLEKSQIAFRHLYLKHWDATYETLPYPPATGIYAIYTIPEFFEYANYALERYNDTQKLAIGTYHFSNPNDTKPPMWMCKTFYTRGKINASSSSYEYDARHKEDCFKLLPVEKCDGHDNCTMQYDVEEYLKSKNKTIIFDRIIDIRLNFTVKTVHLKELSQMSSPDCYEFRVEIKFDNAEHNGQMAIDLTLTEIPLKCHGKIIYDSSNETAILTLSVLLDVVVAVISLVSLVLCLRSICRAQFLKKETANYFKTVLNKELTVFDNLEFLNMWYILIIINDFLTIFGSMLKITIETKANHNYEACGVMLGTANLLVWFGVLRYLGFFEKYNILILTMKKSAPSVLRFLVCASVFYFGFAVCGWVVLGPYHLKFRSLSASSECLFSLLNGDDIFTTFAAIPDNQPFYIWIYSRLFLYLFVAFFTYIVLNLFIAVILDAYEVIKKYYDTGFPKTELHKFIDECPDYSHIPSMSHRHKQSCSGSLCCCLPSTCCYGTSTREDVDEQIEPDERSPLLT